MFRALIDRPVVVLPPLVGGAMDAASQRHSLKLVRNPGEEHDAPREPNRFRWCLLENVTSSRHTACMSSHTLTSRGARWATGETQSKWVLRTGT